MDKKEALKIVQESGSDLVNLSDKFKKDKDVVLEAIKQDAWSLLYANEKLKADKEVVLEAIKQDARRFGVEFLNPCVNLSGSYCIPRKGSLLLGLEFIKEVGERNASVILRERSTHGPFMSVGDFVGRVDIHPEAIESLALSGAFDSISLNRKTALWESGVYPSISKNQRPLPLCMDSSVPKLHDFTLYERLRSEYRVMGIYPDGHIMEVVRDRLPWEVSKISDVDSMTDRQPVSVAGWAIARQHPQGYKGTVFVTVEDETSDIQLIVWPKVFQRFKHVLREPLILARGNISRWDNTTNVIVSELESISTETGLPLGHDWY